MKREYEQLPEEWDSLSLLEKEKWFARHYICYLREGEIDGLNTDVPETVKKAYEEFLHEMERN